MATMYKNSQDNKVDGHHVRQDRQLAALLLCATGSINYYNYSHHDNIIIP